MSELQYSGIIPSDSDINAADMPFGYCNDPSQISGV
jgi:hypothetical protein